MVLGIILPNCIIENWCLLFTVKEGWWFLIFLRKHTATWCSWCFILNQAPFAIHIKILNCIPRIDVRRTKNKKRIGTIDMVVAMISCSEWAVVHSIYCNKLRAATQSIHATQCEPKNARVSQVKWFNIEPRNHVNGNCVCKFIGQALNYITKILKILCCV